MNKNALLKAVNTLLEAESAALLERLEPLQADLHTQNTRIGVYERRLQSALTPTRTLHPEQEIARQQYLATHTPALDAARRQMRLLAAEESLLQAERHQHALRKKLLERLNQKKRQEYHLAAERCTEKLLDEWVLQNRRMYENH